MGCGTLPLLEVDGRAAIIPGLIVEGLIVAASLLLLDRFCQERVGGVALDRLLRSVVLIVVKGLGCERGLGRSFELEGRFLSRL